MAAASTGYRTGAGAVSRGASSAAVGATTTHRHGKSSFIVNLNQGFRKVTFDSPVVKSFTEMTEEEHEGMQKSTFIDVEVMKAKVRQSLLKPTSGVQDYYKKHGIAQAIARSPYFENITLLVIMFNAIWIAYDTDANPAELLLDAEPKFQVAENFFCLYFSIELFVRFSAFERKRNCFRDVWFVFDAFLVFLMVVETWALSVALLTIGMPSGSGGGDAAVIRVARLLRLTRMARMARLLRVIPELMILIKGMLAAVRSVLFTILLLVVIMYVFAISLTQLTSGTPLALTYFSSVPVSMYSLLMHGCLLDGPRELSNALAKESWILPPIFWLFILMAALTIMNMLVGVLCEVVSGVAAVEKEQNLINFVKSRVKDIVQEIDQDGNLCISKVEFCRILENTQACRALQDVGVDVVGLIDFADAIFEDEKGREKSELGFAEFMDLVLQLRGTNVATVKDIVQLRKMVSQLTNQVSNVTRHVVGRRVKRRVDDQDWRLWRSLEADGGLDEPSEQSSLASAEGGLLLEDLVALFELSEARPEERNDRPQVLSSASGMRPRHDTNTDSLDVASSRSGQTSVLGAEPLQVTTSEDEEPGKHGTGRNRPLVTRRVFFEPVTEDGGASCSAGALVAAALGGGGGSAPLGGGGGSSAPSVPSMAASGRKPRRVPDERSRFLALRRLTGVLEAQLAELQQVVLTKYGAEPAWNRRLELPPHASGSTMSL